jgi:hypothetical protein
MTMKEVLDAVVQLDREQRVLWLIDLGWAMTMSARAGYPLPMQTDDPLPHLMAFNELQHQLSIISVTHDPKTTGPPRILLLGFARERRPRVLTVISSAP